MHMQLATVRSGGVRSNPLVVETMPTHGMVLPNRAPAPGISYQKTFRRIVFSLTPTIAFAVRSM